MALGGRARRHRARSVASSITLRVIHVSPYFAPAFRYGGPPQSVLGLCQGLVRAGVDLEVFTTTANGSDPLPPASGGATYGGVRARYFPLAFPKRYWRAAGLDRALAAAAVDADLIHIHGLWNFPEWSAVRAARTAGVPYVISPRGMLQQAAMTHHRVSKVVAYAVAERAYLKGAAFLHATSVDEQRALVPLGRPITLLANGVAPMETAASDIERVRRMTGLRGDALAVLFLGRLHPIKRLDLLAGAFQQVHAAVPRARLVIAGPDENGYRRIVEGLFGPVADSVHWVGAVDGVDKWAWLRTSAVLVQCSDSESFGMSVAEALTVGLPVVVTDRGPWHELRAAGCGWVVAHEAHAIADAVRRVLDSPTEAAEIGGRARAWAARRFGWDEIAHGMIRAYEAAVKGSRASVA